MSDSFPKNAKVPAIAFLVTALAIGTALLAMQIVLRLELMQPGLQYSCSHNGLEFCLFNVDQASAVSQTPSAYFVIFALAPAFLALAVMQFQKAVPTLLYGWIVAAMWVAFALYLAGPTLVLFAQVGFEQQSPRPPASATRWVLYPPLSTQDTATQFEMFPIALALNRVATGVLLGLILLSSIVIAIVQPRSVASKIMRTGFVVAMVGTIWVLVSRLSSFMEFAAADRNLGTSFFDPASQSDRDSLTEFLENLSNLGTWSIVVVFCCLSLLVLARQSRAV